MISLDKLSFLLPLQGDSKNADGHKAIRPKCIRAGLIFTLFTSLRKPSDQFAPVSSTPCTP